MWKGYFCTALFLFCVPLLSHNCLSGGIYKCISESGDVTFSGLPCPADQKEDVIKERNIDALEGSGEGIAKKTSDGKSQKNADKIILTENQLQGTWMDSKEAGPLTTRWIFSKPTMTFIKYNGKTLKFNYTFKDNVLIVHHQPGLLSEKPWDEKMEIISYDGKTLTWRYGTLIKLYRAL